MILLWSMELSLLWHYYGILFDNVILFVSGNYKLNVLVVFYYPGMSPNNFQLYFALPMKLHKMRQNGNKPDKNRHKIILSKSLKRNSYNLCLTVPSSAWTLSITLFLKEILSYQDSRRTDVISWSSVSPFLLHNVLTNGKIHQPY